MTTCFDGNNVAQGWTGEFDSDLVKFVQLRTVDGDNMVGGAYNKTNESIDEDIYDDGKLRLDPKTGKYDPEEVKQMQKQGAEMARQKANQKMRDKLNRDIDVSQKAHTITVEYDLELDTPKSKNPLLKKHYQLMKKFNVFISMPQWEEGPPDSGFGAWFADVRGSKENLKGWLKAWEYDYDERDYEDMGLEESMNEDEEAIAARDEFMKVMDMKPKSSNKAIDTIKKIVADKQNQQVKFDDGKMKVDLYTASAVSQVYDAVKPETQEKIDNMLRTKEGMLKMSNFAFSKLSEGVKAGKRIDEILPALAVVGGIARAVGGKIAKAAIKHPIKTAAVVKTVKDKDKTVTQKATDVARITSSKYDLDELQAPYTGADAVMDKNGKGHKPGSPKANMIINMKKKAPVAKPLQNKTANTSGVKPAQSTVKPAGIGRGNAPGSKATQIQPGGGSKAGMAGMANATPKDISKAKKDLRMKQIKHVGTKVKNFATSALGNAAARSGIGNPLAASKYSPEDKAVDMMKGAMKKVEELSLSGVKKSPPITVKKIPAKGPKGYTPGDHHPPTKFKASVKF